MHYILTSRQLPKRIYIVEKRDPLKKNKQKQPPGEKKNQSYWFSKELLSSALVFCARRGFVFIFCLEQKFIFKKKIM